MTVSQIDSIKKADGERLHCELRVSKTNLILISFIYFTFDISIYFQILNVYTPYCHCLFFSKFSRPNNFYVYVDFNLVYLVFYRD